MDESMITNSQTKTSVKHLSSSDVKQQNEPSRRPASSSSFSMAHALSMVRRRKEQQTKEVRSEEEIKKEKARAKRKRRRENQKLARAKAKSRENQSDDEGSVEDGCTDSTGDKSEMTISKPVENLKRASNECEDDPAITPSPKKRRKLKARKAEKDDTQIQAYDDEAFKASLIKLKSMIPRALMVKKKGIKS